MRIIDILHSPWAIIPNRLIEINEIYARHLRGEKIGKDTISLIESQIGKPLENTDRGYTVQNSTAIISLQGVIAKRMNLLTKISGGTSTELFARDFNAALKDPGIQSIIIHIDSPGGTVDGTKELADLIYSSRGAKPIIAYTDGLMASAAYWIGSAADRIYLSSSTVEVGSIGVIATHTDYSKAEEAAGVKVTEITAGKYKRIASEHAPLTDEGRAYIQEQLDHLYSIFLNDVARNRGGLTADRVHAQMGDGRTFIGENAVKVGLADGVAAMPNLIEVLSAGELIIGSTSMVTISKNIKEAGGDPARMEEDMALTHNSEIAEDEPEWSSWIEENSTKLPDSAFADEKNRSYPHHWVKNGSTDENGKFKDGEMYLHAGGLNAAWAAANGARSGEKASPEVTAHLQEHRKALGLEDTESTTEEASMTASVLMQKHPEAYQAAYDAGYKDGMDKGRAYELKRIMGIKSLTMPGHEKLIEEMMFNSSITLADAAVKLIEAERNKRRQVLAQIKSEGESIKIPASDGTISNQAMSRAEFEKLTPAQRVAFLRSGGKLQN